MNVDVLAFGAHPDDVEIGAAGALALEARRGRRVGIVDLTRAELSSNGSPERRQEEADRAARIIGLAFRANLELPDRGITGGAEQLRLVVETIRRYRPWLVLAPYWQDRHPDHEAASKLVSEACFSAGLRRLDTGQEPFRPARVIYYFLHHDEKPSFLVDVSETYEIKLAALAAYGSQFGTGGAGKQEITVATVLNSGFIDRIVCRDRYFGTLAGCRYAEGFLSREPVIQAGILPVS